MVSITIYLRGDVIDLSVVSIIVKLTLPVKLFTFFSEKRFLVLLLCIDMEFKNKLECTCIAMCMMFGACTDSIACVDIFYA